MSGRFPLTGDNDIDTNDALQGSVLQVTAIVDVEDRLTPVSGGLSDFIEAVNSTNEWAKLTSKIEELCLIYTQKKTL